MLSWFRQELRPEQPDPRRPATIYVNGRFLQQPITGIQRYGRELIFDLFKYCLQRSADATSVRNWDTVNHGAGVLDAEALLRCELPPPGELIAS